MSMLLPLFTNKQNIRSWFQCPVLLKTGSSSCRSSVHVSERDRPRQSSKQQSFQHILSQIEAMILLSIIFCSWAEECGAVHWGGTAQKLFHGDAGAERTLWHCSISGADWWLKVSNPLLLPLTSDWQLRLSQILSKRKLTERDKSLIITAWGSLCVCALRHQLDSVHQP